MKIEKYDDWFKCFVEHLILLGFDTTFLDKEDISIFSFFDASENPLKAANFYFKENK